MDGSARADRVGGLAAAPPTPPGQVVLEPASAGIASFDVLHVSVKPVMGAAHPQAQLLVDVDRVVPAMVDAINHARSVVNVEMFNFASNGSGQAIADALKGAIRRGVEVNVIVDQVTLFGLPVLGAFRLTRELKRMGAHVVVTGVLADSRAARHTDHRKVITVDGNTAYLGGINLGKITDSYHDAMFELHGAAAADLCAEQARRWQEVSGYVSSRHQATLADARRGARIAQSPLQLQINAPHLKRFDLTEHYMARIASAKHRIWITSPGYSDLKVVRALADAARRGVDVRVMIPGKPPLALPIIVWNARANLREVMRAGGRVYEYPGISHLKALIVDDEASLGTYNATIRSARHDHEIGVTSRDPRIVRQIGGLLRSDLAQSRVLKPSDIRGVGQSIMNFLRDEFMFQY